MEFKSIAQDGLDRGKTKEIITELRIDKCEDSISSINKCISSIGPKSSIDKDELIKLIANKAEREIDDKVSKASFDEARDRIFGKIKDVTNKDEELESRIKIIERKIQEDILRNKLAPQTPDDKKKQSNMFVPNMDGIHKRFSDIDGYIDSLRRNIKSIDQRLKKEITLLTDTKSDKHAQKELEKETEMIKIKLDKLDLNVHQNKEDLETRMNLIEKESIPRMEDKVKLQEEITHINTNRIENIELKYEQLSKIIAKISSDEFDVTVVDRMEDKLKKFANQINIFRGDFETTIKEIRNILYTKADDESITDLENKVLLKLNELVENICK